MGRTWNADGDRGEATGLNVITHIGLEVAEGALDFRVASPCFIMLQLAMVIAMRWCIIIARQQGSCENADVAETLSVSDTST